MSESINKISSSASNVPCVDPVSCSVQVAAIITNTVNGIVDKGKRQNLEQAIGALNEEQKYAIANELAVIEDQERRQQILSDSLALYLSSDANKKTKGLRGLSIVIAIVGVVVITTVFIVLNKK